MIRKAIWRCETPCHEHIYNWIKWDWFAAKSLTGLHLSWLSDRDILLKTTLNMKINPTVSSLQHVEKRRLNFPSDLLPGFWRSFWGLTLITFSHLSVGTLRLYSELLDLFQLMSPTTREKNMWGWVKVWSHSRVTLLSLVSLRCFRHEFGKKKKLHDSKGVSLPDRVWTCCPARSDTNESDDLPVANHIPVCCYP